MLSEMPDDFYGEITLRVRDGEVRELATVRTHRPTERDKSEAIMRPLWKVSCGPWLSILAVGVVSLGQKGRPRASDAKQRLGAVRHRHLVLPPPPAASDREGLCLILISHHEKLNCRGECHAFRDPAVFRLPHLPPAMAQIFV